MTTGTTPPTYPTVYGRVATAALTRGWSVSHRDLGPQHSHLTAQRGALTLTFTFDSRIGDDGVYYLASIILTQLAPYGAGYTECSRLLDLTDAMRVLQEVSRG